MKATDLLKKQHREVEKLFERIEKAASREKKALFEELASNLVAHDGIEREIFYPACERRMDDKAMLREALVEHGLVEFTLFHADRETGDEDKLDARLKVLKDVVEHHVEEEEKELFPKVEKELGSEMLEELGTQMEMRFEKAKEEDFRVPLQRNVKQVIGGAQKTSPTGRTRTTTAKAARGRPTRSSSSRTTRSKAAKRSSAKKSGARKATRSRATR